MCIISVCKILITKKTQIRILMKLKKMRRKSDFLFLTIFLMVLFICITLTAKSQVTIGTLTPPLEGTLLELKDFDVSDGGMNAAKGMKFSRVELVEINSLIPLFITTNVTVKATYTGTVVYNVTENTAFEKGLYVWDGTQWERFQTSSDLVSINAENGLSVSDDYIQLGGNLIQSTTIGLDGNHLAFARESGNIGIGANSPNASLHLDVATAAANDPVIVTSISSINNPLNTEYSNVVISDGGVVRTAPLSTYGDVTSSEVFVNRLTANQTVSNDGNASGSGATWLSWSGAVSGQYITLPHDGAYVFHFRLSGTSSATSGAIGHPFYLSAFNGANLEDIVEIVVDRIGSSRLTYTVFLVVSGKKDDQIRFKLAGRNNTTTWTLSGGGNAIPTAQRTIMTYWAL